MVEPTPKRSNVFSGFAPSGQRHEDRSTQAPFYGSALFLK